MNQLYILTDAEGFTTCCDATMLALSREGSRRPLMAPIEVFHWIDAARDHRGVSWRLKERWTWTGAPF